MMTSEDLQVAGVTVSRETMTALKSFESLVQRWNSAINLVSKASLNDLWHRHIVDSAQLFQLCPQVARNWVDLGSGGGFPGIVVAILAANASPDLRVTLVESDQRKATFLRQAIQVLQLGATVRSERVESIAPLNADVLSARALAPLSQLLPFAAKHLRSDGLAIFPKGARYAEELTEGQKDWAFDVEMKPSFSDSEAAILLIRKINRAKKY
jgi:16S rRNA (guanine527-N7)-methyltransferase